MAPSDLVRGVKNNSTNLVNEKRWVRGKFSWQEGYGAFSYSHSQLDTVYKYIVNQDHKKKSFREEYLAFLEKFNVPFEEQYLFDLIDYVTPLGSTLDHSCLSIIISRVWR